MSQHRRAQGAPRQTDLASLARRIAIWLVFFALVYLLRAFFPLLLLTFVITYAGSSAVSALGKHFPRANRRALVSAVFIGGLGVLSGLGYALGPSIAEEHRHFVERFPELREGIARWVEDTARAQPTLMRTLDPDGALPNDIRAFSLSDLQRPKGDAKTQPLPLLEDVSPFVLNFARATARIVGTVLLALLFSFLILLDLPKLRREIDAVRVSRIAWLFLEVRGSVVDFGNTLGRVMEAQVVIAVVNTVLTFLGLWWLGVPSKFLLSVIVFACSFIPVLGVFISTLPICVIALAQGGMGLVVKCVVMIIAVHAVEAYILNPRITGQHVRLNPVLVLAVLVIGEHLFGLWGLILGVPVAVTLLRRTQDIVRSRASKSHDPGDDA